MIEIDYIDRDDDNNSDGNSLAHYKPAIIRRKRTQGIKAYATDEVLLREIHAYFDWADANGKPLSIARLANWLGVDRQTIYNYKAREDYGQIIQYAVDYITASMEERCIMDGKPGQIFILKNYGYSDKTEIESTNTNVTADIHDLADEERKRRLAELLRKAGVDNG